MSPSFFVRSSIFVCLAVFATLSTYPHYHHLSLFLSRFRVTERVQDCARYGVGEHSAEKQMHDHSFEWMLAREGHSVNVVVMSQ